MRPRSASHPQPAPRLCSRGRVSAIGTSRRAFLGAAVTTPLAAGVVAPLAAPGRVFAAGPQRLRVGLVGCGGRGTGAAAQAIAADPSVRLVALGDLFADQLESAADLLERRTGEQFECPPERRFVGAEAFRHVIASGVDVVLLATPPHLRPLHLEAAVAAGKHVYCERPVAIDVAGVVRAATAAARARAAGLAVVSGFCHRRDARTSDCIARVHDGAIGRPLHVEAHAALGLPWRKPYESGHDPAAWPLRNWVSFRRFSGGHFVAHHVEAIDRAAWLLGDDVPTLIEPLPHPEPQGPDAIGAIGDCRACVAVRYLFADGRSILASIDRRQRAGWARAELAVGTAGTCDLHAGVIDGPRGRHLLQPPAAGRHQAAMDALVSGILSGRPADDGRTMCQSTLLAVLGSLAAETGRRLPWPGPPEALAATT
jgi:predicted dehydrogenase